MKPKVPNSPATPQYPEIANDIIREVYDACTLLGADVELLSIIGSWNETLDDKTVLEGLRYWNTLKIEELKEKKQKIPRSTLSRHKVSAEILLNQIGKNK